MLFWLFILIILVLTVMGAVVGYDTGETFLCGALNFIGSALLMGLVFLFICIGVTHGDVKPDRVELVNSEELSALGTDSELGGQFFLGTGIIDEKPVIKYIRKDLSGGYVLDTIESSMVKIFEISDGSQPRIETERSFVYKQWLAPFEMEAGSTKISFYVPEGSIIETYRLDVNSKG